MTFKLLVPNTIQQNVEPISGSEIIYYDPQLPITSEHHDAEGIVIWGGRLKWLQQTAQDLSRVRWVQGLAAGPDAILKAGFRPEAVLTNGVGLHNHPVTEHTLALVLAAARSLPTASKSQAEATWDFSIGGGIRPLSDSTKFTTLRNSRVIIWGYGSIARTITPVLQLFGAKVTGVASRARQEGEVQVVATEDIDALLPETDLVIMLLPSMPATDDVMNLERMKLLPQRAWLVNVGRGNSVNEEDLDYALRNGIISGAAIDVTKIEPLPADSPLWKTPNLIITPHAAGGRPVEPEKLIQKNLSKLLAGETLDNLVPRNP